MSSTKMKEMKIDSAEWLSKHQGKSDASPGNSEFDRGLVDLSDIEDGARYYEGFDFIPSTTKDMLPYLGKIGWADAGHCTHKGPDSQGTFFLTGFYDANNNLIPCIFSHRIGNESSATWDSVWRTHRDEVDALNTNSYRIFHDGEKGLGKGLAMFLPKSSGILDPNHLRKNITKKLGSAAGKTAVTLYDRAFHSPDVQTLELRKAEFTPALATYLGKFDDMQLYLALWEDHDRPIYSSQGPFALQIHIYDNSMYCDDINDKKYK